MRIGIRAHDFGRLTPSGLAQTVRQNGFDAVQLAPAKAISGIESPADIPLKVLSEIRQVFSALDIEISVFGCYIDPAADDDAKRREQLDIFLKNIEYAKYTGARLIGTETTSFKGSENQRESRFRILVSSVREMVKRAEDMDMDVGIEPVAVHTLNTPELAARLLDEIKSDRLRIIFDPVNLLTAENVTRQTELWPLCIRCFGSKISAVHIKDAAVLDGRIVEAPLGEGLVDYHTLFTLLRKAGIDCPVLREGLKSGHAAADIKFIRDLT